jgi:hypothetical protein
MCWNHLLAPLMLEVDVDVGGLLALLRDERSKRSWWAAGSTAVMPRT